MRCSIYTTSFTNSLLHPLPPLLLLPLPSSTTLYLQPSKQGLGSYCLLLMLSNQVLFRCCRTVWLSKFVIVQNSYLCLGSDCHCSSLFHTSFCSSLLAQVFKCSSLFHSSVQVFFTQVFAQVFFTQVFL